MFHLRPGRRDEFDLVMAIDDDACTLYAEVGLGIDTARDPAFFAHETATWRQSAADGQLWFACTEEGEPVAFAAFGLVDGAAYLHQLSTRRAFMRRGLGRRLVTHGAEWVDGSGVLWLATYDHVPFNAPFYTRLGFTPVAEPAWGPELRVIVAAEQRALPAPDHRIVMRYDRTSSRTAAIPARSAAGL